jgi:hypothetical protein
LEESCAGKRKVLIEAEGLDIALISLAVVAPDALTFLVELLPRQPDSCTTLAW